MTRNTEPQLYVTHEMGDEGRARLALFVDTVRRQPQVVAAVLRHVASCEEVIGNARQSDEDESYTADVFRAIAPILEHQDDLHIEPDQATAAAMRHDIELERRRGPLEGDRRRILRVITYAGELAAYQDYVETIGPGTREAERAGNLVSVRPVPAAAFIEPLPAPDSLPETA